MIVAAVAVVGGLGALWYYGKQAGNSFISQNFWMIGLTPTYTLLLMYFYQNS